MRIRAVAAAMCASGFLLSAGATPVTIELLPQVNVRSSQVRFGQIAHLTTSDLTVLRKLLASPLGSAPKAGETVMLDRPVLERWLRSRLGLNKNEVVWTGAVTSAVSRASREVDAHEITAAAQDALQAWLATRSARALVQLIRAPDDVRLPEGEVNFAARPIDDNQPRKRMLVWVDAWVDERFVRSLPVSFEVTAWADAAVALSAAPTGTPLDARSFASREVDLTRLSAAAIPSAKVGAGERLRRPVRPGEVLTTLHVEAAPAVTRGDWVTARAAAGGVALESRVEVLQDGHVGQAVRVRQANASNSITARVTAQGQVEVEP